MDPGSSNGIPLSQLAQLYHRTKPIDSSQHTVPGGRRERERERIIRYTHIVYNIII